MLKGGKRFYQKLISRRILIAGSIKTFLLSILGLRLGFLQIISGEKYKTLSNMNRINLVFLQPRRGKILDCSDSEIAGNAECFRLLIDLTLLKNDKSKYFDDINKLQNILSLKEDEIISIKNIVKQTRFNIPVTIMDNLSWTQVALVESSIHLLQFIIIEFGTRRQYCNLEYGGSLIGYLGKVNSLEKKLFSDTCDPDVRIGKSGVEKQYNKLLMGRYGYKRMEVNAHSRFIREVEQKLPLAGDDVKLTINSALQNKVAPYIKELSCAAIVMDCNKGDILLSISKPDFNPERFLYGDTDYWKKIQQDSLKPLINRNIQTSWPIGSAFKIITCLAALEAGIDPNKKIFCNGASALGTKRFNCWKQEGHGKVNMHQAIQSSCNRYIFEIARIIGHDPIINMAKKLGFGVKTDIDLPYETAGFVPDEKWKKKQFNDSWRLGDTLNLSVGQGFFLASNIQIARAMASIANGGRLLKPRILVSSSDLSINNNVEYKKLDIASHNLDIIKNSMISVVNDIGGTAFSWGKKPSYKLAGKTGTAQVSSKKNKEENLSSISTPWNRRNHALFAGFTPFDNPKYVISVFVEHGRSGGAIAAPIAKKIAEELNKINS